MTDRAKLQEGRYRVGVVGCGRQGTCFARAFATSPAAEIVAGGNRCRDTFPPVQSRSGRAYVGCRTRR